jgi:hypothetical protein
LALLAIGRPNGSLGHSTQFATPAAAAASAQLP